MFDFSARTQKELNREIKRRVFRFKQLLGALFLVGLALFFAAKFWFITVPVVAFVVAVRIVRRNARRQQRR